MHRETGLYRITKAHGEQVRAFVPHPLPPSSPPLAVEGPLSALHSDAASAVDRLRVSSDLVPDIGWFLYGFVRKEAVVSSQIEGTQATLEDVARFEATVQAARLDDVREVCNYVDALTFARGQLSDAAGLPISTRLLCEAHRRLMRGARGEHKLPGEIRRSQNWIGGTRPGHARFVPPPPEEVGSAMSALERWIHSDDPLPPLVRAGLAHVQFETIHPFLDGNGRIGRMLVSLLVEHWGVLDQPLLYLSIALKRRQQEYYVRLDGVRTGGDWEGWTAFFLECVREAADDAVHVAGRLSRLVGDHRTTLLGARDVTVTAARLFELLPGHPIMTLSRATELLAVSKATAAKAIDALVGSAILRETTGMRRDRVYAYQGYLDALTGGEH